MPDISMPSMGFEKEKKPVIPVSVSYAFDSSVTDATLEIQACDFPYTLKTGEHIVQAFLAMGQEVFESVTAYEGTGQAVQTTQPSDLIIQISLLDQSFQAIDRMAEEENYLAALKLHLRAVFLDQNGAELAQTPLTFNNQVKLWTPAITGQSVSCVTGRYDSSFSSAAVELAEQLVDIVPELIRDGRPQPLAATQNRQPTFATSSTPRFAPQAPVSAAQTNRPLTFRTMLKDGNDNLILEGGEAIVLMIEATNVGNAAITTVNANVVGNATLVEAFSKMTTLPISMGTFQSGETRTTEIRGRMPLNIRAQKAELTVALTLADKTSIGSHRIVAPLQPGVSAPGVQAGTPAPQLPVRESRPQPSVKAPTPQPSIMVPEPKPSIEEPEPQLSAKEPEPRPSAGEPELQPPAEEPKSQPPAGEPEPQPSVKEPEPQSSVMEPEPQPSAGEPESQPPAKEPEPQPSAMESAPQHPAGEPTPQPSAGEPEPQSSVKELKPQSSAMESEPQLSVKEPTPQPSVMEPEPQSPTREPEPSSTESQTPPAIDTKAMSPVMDSDTTPPPATGTEAYMAMLIGMDAYQDAWPEAYHMPQDLPTTLRDTLQQTSLFTDQGIRVLQGSQAVKSAIEGTLLTWVRQRAGEESVLVLYVSGQAVKDRTNGEVYLVPYEGSPDASTGQLISLRILQRLLGKLENRLTLLILDTPIAPLGNQDQDDAVDSPANWASGLDQQDETTVIQLRRLPGQEDSNPTPANILAGLSGSADEDQNGTITVGEFLKHASESNEITPLLPDSSPLLTLPLAQ